MFEKACRVPPARLPARPSSSPVRAASSVAAAAMVDRYHESPDQGTPRRFLSGAVRLEGCNLVTYPAVRATIRVSRSSGCGSIMSTGATMPSQSNCFRSSGNLLIGKDASAGR